MTKGAPGGNSGQSANGPGRARPAAAVAAAALLAALLVCALAAASLNWYATAYPAAGLTVRLCAGFTAESPMRLGVAWQSSLPTISYVSPLLVSPYALCLRLPHAWIAPNPQAHAWEWLWP